jgi:N-carbamoylputrescine amidase
MSRSMTVALVSDVFFDGSGADRLRDRLRDARMRGADLALLPEIPLNPWSPATTAVRDDDAEAPGGARHQMLACAARDAGLGVVGGAIVRDPATGVRHNTALVFDARGELVARYAKVHLPDEEGFREPSHYAPGTQMAEVIAAFGFPFGVQICSDMNRPQGSHLLGAMGAAAILNPRATQAATFDRWKLIFRANALTSCAYVLSVTRPSPEHGVAIGGPAVAVDPDGNVLLETFEPVACVTLDESVVARARRRYPGYLQVNAALYARGWSNVAGK